MKKKIKVLTLLMVVALLVTACGASNGSSIPEGTSVLPEVEDTDDTEHQDSDADVDTEVGHDDDADSESSAIDPEAVYQNNCSRCHSADRSGGRGPALLPDRLTGDATQYSNIISNGQGGMPSWNGKLSVEEIDAVAEWILTTHK